MFTEKNFKSALDAMNFEKISDSVYQKNFGENISMSADFKNKKLTYPTQLKNCEKNNLLDSAHKENLVVFECVHRLLEKGYKPEHIELEKAWHLGHETKSGRADICVSNFDGELLCIIECKTFGKEFTKELKNLQEDGGQLFSYWQQERNCKWLVLYTSTLDEKNEKIIPKSETVDCSDDKNILTAAEKNPEVKTYKNSYTVENLYDTWVDTYEKKLLGDLFFNENTTAYKVGLKPLKISDLQDLSETDGIINKIEEILRHNNISDYANAFNRLIALFICKLVDESQKNFDDEVDFQYKIGVDSYEILQDRLQRLHRDGMEKFMDEKIFYMPDDYAKNLVQQVLGQNREIMIQDLQNNLRKLKFFTNNDFAFKEVHNEELFYQNGKVLVEMVRLFQKFKIISPNNLQTLGDMFEQLLDKGFKQNEGQFFTPIPIARFIWDSLPLEKIISDEPPKIIDYACGAGHFLTQGFKAINDFTKNTLPKGWEDRKIFGIEKDYRLARVSRISFFMHGANKGSVIFGDGLENNFDKYIRPADFDILISNPPYSVKSFKPHLKLENKFDTLEKVSNDGSEIETLFVERIAQLVKPCGIAAVILPSSILNKDGKSFICAREKILQNFYIRAIAEFGSKTFGATGTKTNIIFLEKLEDTPKRFNLLGDSVTQIFKDDIRTDFEDKKIFDAWLKKINTSEEIYKNFVNREKNFSEWADDSYFGEYVTAFENSTEYKNKISQVTFQNLSDTEKISLLNQKFYDFAQSVEKEKILYFAQTFEQMTLIISAPDDNSEQEKFLGYTWSNRKGDEGIKIKTPGGLLYNPDNRNDENKLAAAVRKSFSGEQIKIPESEKYFNYFNLSDLIDFSGTNFTKIIKLTKKIETTYSGNFEIISLGKAATYVTEKISIDEIKISDYVTTDNMLKDKRGIKIFEGEPQISSVTKFLPNDILISNIRPYLKKIWFADRAGGCSNDVLAFRSFDEKILLPRYLFLILSQDYFFDFVMADIKGLKMPRGDKKNILTFKFPLPSLEEQKKIIGEFTELDEKISNCDKKIISCDLAIKNKFAEMFGGFEKNISFSKIFIDDTKNGEKIPASEYLTEGKIPIIDQSVNEIAGYSNSEENFYKNLPCIIFGDHTEIFKYVRTCLKSFENKGK
ncbi:MAG: N-6 DNA methylase [Selenomonadaceae bacterium]|nr:N-6 DNA methylase [Selenomonadaceae bacterium]